MESAAHIEALRHDGAQLVRAAEAAGLDAPVRTCPEWTVRDLVHHVTGVHRWATMYVATGRNSPTTADEDAPFFAPRAGSEVIAAFRRGHAELVRALEEADPELRCWSFLAAPSPRAFWARRQAHETHIHRVDAEAAAGWSSLCDRELATDGIDELLNGFLARPQGRLVADPPRSLGISATDDPAAAWTISIEPDRRVVRPGIRRPDCTVRGAAADLYHHLWNRLPAGDTSVEVIGDPSVVQLWRERATIRWS